MICPLGIQKPLLASTPLGLGSYSSNLQFLKPLGNQKLTTLNPAVFRRSLEPSTPTIQTVFDPLIGDSLTSNGILRVPDLDNGNKHQLHQPLEFEERTLKPDSNDFSQTIQTNDPAPLEEVSPLGDMIQTAQNVERLEHATALESPTNLNPIQPTTAKLTFQHRQSDDSATAITTIKPKQDSVIQPLIANPVPHEYLPGANAANLNDQLNNQSLVQAKELVDYPTIPTSEIDASGSIDAEGVDPIFSQSVTDSNSQETTISLENLSEPVVSAASIDSVKSEELTSSDYSIQTKLSPTISSDSDLVAKPSNLSDTDFQTPLQTTTFGSVISNIAEESNIQEFGIDEPFFEETVTYKSLPEISAPERTVTEGPAIENLIPSQASESSIDVSTSNLQRYGTLSNISENNSQDNYGADTNINHPINPLEPEPASQQLDISNSHEDLDELPTLNQSPQLSESLTVLEIPSAEESISTGDSQHSQLVQNSKKSSASVEHSAIQISVPTEDRAVSPDPTEAIQRKSLPDISHEQAPETAKFQSASPLQELDELATDLQPPLVDNQPLQELSKQLISPASDKKVAKSPPVKTKKNIAQQNVSSLAPVSIAEQAFRKTAPISSDINSDVNSIEIRHLPKGLESTNILSMLGKTPLGRQTRNSLGNRRNSLVSNAQELIKPFPSHAQMPQNLVTSSQVTPSASDMVSMEQTSQFYSPSAPSDVSASIVQPPEINSLSAIRSSPEPHSANWQRLSQPVTSINPLSVKALSHDIAQAIGSVSSISNLIPSYPSTPPYPDLNALQQFREPVQLPKKIHHSPVPAPSIAASDTPIEKIANANAKRDLTASTADLDQLTNYIYQLIKHRLITAQERRGHYNRRLG